MIQDTILPLCHQQVGVLARLSFGNSVLKSCFFRRKSSKSGCGKGCGHKKGSNSVAYDDSYCDKGFTRQKF